MRKKMISLMMTVAMGTVMISGATVVKADSDEKETVKLAVWSSGAAEIFRKVQMNLISARIKLIL